MRITYRTLEGLIAKMNDDQKDSDVTVEIPTDGPAECFSAELRIAGEMHDGGLDDDHPVIFVHVTDEEQNRESDINHVANHIGL